MVIPIFGKKRENFEDGKLVLFQLENNGIEKKKKKNSVFQSDMFVVCNRQRSSSQTRYNLMDKYLSIGPGSDGSRN